MRENIDWKNAELREQTERHFVNGRITIEGFALRHFVS